MTTSLTKTMLCPDGWTEHFLRMLDWACAALLPGAHTEGLIPRRFRQRTGGIALLVALCLGTAARASGQAQTLDRVVASVGKTAITESDVLREYRIEEFLDDVRVPAGLPAPDQMKTIRDRLIDQKLLEFEASEPSPGADPSNEEALERLTRLEKKFPDEAAFHAALQPLGITQEQLIERLTAQQRILNIVDKHLRPAAAVSSDEIKDYYQRTLLPELAHRGNRNPPPLPAVEAKIREVLVQKKMNRLLAAWLSQLRAEHDVKLLPL
ncbi:MAG TPA: hypothetical protein VMX16_05405 [Terriglobia bacterium]|nr:hypothetical protein [Terriglobia bacterium]